jgi:hypothetical protein
MADRGSAAVRSTTAAEPDVALIVGDAASGIRRDR